MAAHEFTEQRFAGPVGVDIGGVDEIAAGFAIGVVHFSRLVFCRAPSPIFAKGHRAEGNLRNAQPAIAQESVSHLSFPFHELAGVIRSCAAASSRHALSHDIAYV